jgi:signal transduction histidine kinase
MTEHVASESSTPLLQGLLLIGLGLVTGLLAAWFAVARSLRRRTARLVEAERRAQAAERLAELGSMTSGLAHEIKNPLSTLHLNAQLLREDVLDADLPQETRAAVSRRVDALARETLRLKDILSDFLQFAGRLRLDPQPRDLRDLLSELVDFFQPQSDRAGVLLRVDVPGVPVVARIDAGLLKQALLNLAINAVQAMSPSGQVPTGERRGELLFRLELDSLGHEARLSVIDSGPGIPEERRSAIFRPYASSKPGGTGLGLATTRRIVEEHGGTITLYNGPTGGACFTLRLPLAGPPATSD